MTLANSFDLDGRLSAMDAFNGGTPVLDLDYSYDLAGNITGIADTGGGHRGRNYTYDSLHRLTQAQELAPGGGSVALQTDYSYDAVGNRLTRTVDTASETYSYDTASNRLLSVLGGGVTRAFTYSASGNVTVDDLAGAATTLTYNAADRLVRVEAGAVTLAEYVYAATGQRAVKDVAGTVTHYLYDPGGALYAETDGAGAVLREYITLGGATIAIVDAGGVSYVHDDHLATPQVMTDGAAAVVWDASYRPFGEASIAGAAANAQRFPGQTADSETGYYDNWHRTYDPALGRYLQSDPIGLRGGWNTYAYVGGNPVMYADPTGQFAFLVPLFFGFASGAAWDIGFQLIMNGGKFHCIEWTSVLISGAIGAAGGGLGYLATGFRWGRAGMEFSHWVPDRFFRPLSLSGRSVNKFYKPWLDQWWSRWFRNSNLNGNIVPRWFHYLTDPFRWLSRAEMEAIGGRLHPVFQQILRIPAWLGGSVVGGLGGAAVTTTSTTTECRCE